MNKYVFYGHEFQWRGDLSPYTLRDLDLQDIEISGVRYERKILIEAIELWLKRC